jgi:hypothetical protein
MEDVSKASNRFLSRTMTKPHRYKLASLGVKVFPLPVPSIFENELPVNKRVRIGSIAILKKAKGILLAGTVKKYATVTFPSLLMSKGYPAICCAES